MGVNTHLILRFDDGQTTNAISRCGQKLQLNDIVYLHEVTCKECLRHWHIESSTEQLRKE